jgi:hypothetical protein
MRAVVGHGGSGPWAAAFQPNINSFPEIKIAQIPPTTHRFDIVLLRFKKGRAFRQTAEDNNDVRDVKPAFAPYHTSNSFATARAVLSTMKRYGGYGTMLG